MNRLYVVETEVTCTGAKADHRLALPPREIERFARALAEQLGERARIGDKEIRRQGDTEIGELREKWIAAVAKDLQAHRGRCLVIAGHRQPPAFILLAHAINDRLGNVGQTVILYRTRSRPIPSSKPSRCASWCGTWNNGTSKCFVILGGNPAYTAPADFRFTEGMQKVPLRDPPEPLSGRNIAAMSLALAGSPLPGSLE